MEREVGEGMKRRGRRKGGGEMRRRRGIIVVGIALLLVLGCNNGLAEELEKKSSFFDSVIKIGHEFQGIFGQGIFGVFGDAIGDVLGFNAVKSGDTRDKVGAHFEKVKKGLNTTKNKLNDLSNKISETKNADGSAVKVVEESIKGANGVFDKLIVELDKLASATNDSDAIGHNAATAAAPANKDNVESFISGVKEILGIAINSGVKIDEGKGKEGREVTKGSDSAAAMLGGGTAPAAGTVAKLADEVAQADLWAIIDKIKNSTKTKTGGSQAADNDSAGELATGANHSGNNGVTAANKADFAAAVALKAMIKGGKFSANVGDSGAVKAVATNVVNKVLGVLDEIIRRTVNIELGKVKDAVKGIQYSENNGEATEAKK